MLGNLITLPKTNFFFRKKPRKRASFFLERPRALRYTRSFKKYIKNKAVPHRSVAGHLKLGALGFKSLGAYRLRVNQIEAVRKFVVKYYKKKKIKIIFNIVFDNPLTKKGLGVRMGKGKGKLDSFLCNIRSGCVFLELDGFKKKDF